MCDYFSELENVLEIARIETDLKIIDRVKWAMKESKVSDIQVRLQSNKTSLTLMLTILQWFAVPFLSPVVRSVSELSSQIDVLASQWKRRNPQ